MISNETPRRATCALPCAGRAHGRSGPPADRLAVRQCIWSPMRARGRPSGIDALGVFGVALLARMSVVWWASTRFPPAEDGHYYDVLARRLASGAGFTWLWPDRAVTFAARYPVRYPALLAVAYAVLRPS